MREVHKTSDDIKDGLYTASQHKDLYPEYIDCWLRARVFLKINGGMWLIVYDQQSIYSRLICFSSQRCREATIFYLIWAVLHFRSDVAYITTPSNDPLVNSHPILHETDDTTEPWVSVSLLKYDMIEVCYLLLLWRKYKNTRYSLSLFLSSLCSLGYYAI